jgi:hypothetical protein
MGSSMPCRQVLQLRSIVFRQEWSEENSVTVISNQQCDCVLTVVSNQQCDWTEFVLGREIPPFHIGENENTNVISPTVFTKCDNCFRLDKKEARKSFVIELRMDFGITHVKR